MSAAITAAARSGMGLLFVGGEATLAPELPEWARLAAQQGIARIAVFSNARMASYRGYAAALRAAGVTDLFVLLLGHSAALHEYLTGAAGSFDQTVAGLRAAVAAGVAVRGWTVITRPNAFHLTEISLLARSLGATRQHFEYPDLAALSAGPSSPLVARLSLLEPHLLRALRRAREIGLAVRVSGVPACLLDGSSAPLAPARAMLRCTRALDGALHETLMKPGEPSAPGFLTLGGDAIGVRATIPGIAEPDAPDPCALCRERSRCALADSTYARRYGRSEFRALAPQSTAAL